MSARRHKAADTAAPDAVAKLEASARGAARIHGAAFNFLITEGVPEVKAAEMAERYAISVLGGDE